MASAVLSPEAPSSALVRALTGWRGGRVEALTRTKGCPVLAPQGGAGVEGAFGPEGVFTGGRRA